jgi:hypothetical protein
LFSVDFAADRMHFVTGAGSVGGGAARTGPTASSVLIEAGPGSERTPAAWSGRALFFADQEGAPCAVRHKIDYAKNRIIVSLPASCLGETRTVRTQAQFSVSDHFGSEDFVKPTRRVQVG